MSKWRPVAFAAPVAVVLMVGLSGSQPSLCKITPEELSKVIDESKVLGSDTDVRAELHEADKEAVIFATRNAEATDKDCKIDAVLIAKKVMDTDPAGVSKVRVRFLDKSNKNSYREISVRAGDVKAYAARVIDQDTLLNELDLVKGQEEIGLAPKSGATTGLPEVGAGVLPKERARLLAAILALRARGVGVSPFMAQFNQIEKKAQDGNESEVAGSIQSLNDAVYQQHKQWQTIQEQKQAQQAEKNRMMEERRRLAARTPASVPSAPGQPSPGAPGSYDRYESHEDHEQREKEWHERFDRKLAALGDLTPVDGPHRRRRGRIALRLNELRESGQNVAKMMKPWNDLQRLASNNSEDGVSNLCAAMEKALGMPYGGWHHEEHER